MMMQGLGQYISGAILFEETLYQSGNNGRKMTDMLTEQGIIPGIKVDKGLAPMANSNGCVLAQWAAHQAPLCILTPIH